MNKKHFKEAIDEIHADKKLKVETLNKITNKKSYMPGIVALLVCMVLVIGIVAFVRPKPNQQVPEPILVAEQLPSVGSYEHLREMLKETVEDNENNYIYYDSISIDGILNSSIKSTEDIRSDSMAMPESTKKYSETNVQVQGIDESDIVKTDGKYIYYVSRSKLVIVNAKNPNNLKIEAEIDYSKNSEFYPNEIYVYNDKLLIVGNREYRVNQETNKTFLNDKIGGREYVPPKYFSAIKVYNIKNKTNVVLEREVEIEGSYVSSRMIEGNVYLITNKYLQLYNQTEFDEASERDFQVEYKDTIKSQEMQAVNYDKMYYFEEGDFATYLNIVAFNVNKNAEANVTTYLGAGHEVYCSMNNIYVSNTLYEYKDYGYYRSSKTDTEINKFKLDGASVIFVAKGTVPGEILNQFSMDEQNGYFRIATTKHKGFSSEKSTNNLYVLDKNLEIVGRVEDLAKGERIYSVRFMGNRAYMVTYKETDPLFVIDLSIPNMPKVLGELKIPGYSDYLHPYDETHIIGFGKDTKVDETYYGERITEEGMKMALFDVSDPINPKEMFVEKIGESGTYSELLYNHKALLFSKEKDLIAFPISIRGADYKDKFQGAIVYGLTLKDGFKLKGQISHVKRDGNYYDSKTKVERIIYIDNALFTLSQGLIKSTDMNTMEELSSVQIQVDDGRFYYPPMAVMEDAGFID